MLKWIDCHSHWADQRLDSRRDQWLHQAQTQGLTFALQGGVSPNDWDRQEEIQKKFPDLVGLCFGLHPFWVAEHSQLEIEEALDQLSRRVSKAMAIGETGLDLRPPYAKAYEHQMEAFQSQLELSFVVNKPVVFHVVRAFHESLRVLDLWGVPPAGGFIHSFNGSWVQAQEYLKRGLKLSFGGPLLREQNQRLKQVAREVPLTEFLLETDLPDQPGDPWKGDLNPPESLVAVAEEFARLKKMEVAEVLHFSETNFRTLFRIK
jgi:TatD DNase family protein